MYFVNAEKLGFSFLNHNYPIIGDTAHNLASDPNNISRSVKALKFRWWVSKVIIPSFNLANPQRQVSPHFKVIANHSGNGNRDVHTDSDAFSGRVHVTLGVPVRNDYHGTLFTLEPLLKGISVDDMSHEHIEDLFISAPPRYASVFDPDAELHAAPPISRMLFKARLDSMESFSSSRPAPPILCPISDICIDPLANI